MALISTGKLFWRYGASSKKVVVRQFSIFVSFARRCYN